MPRLIWNNVAVREGIAKFAEAGVVTSFHQLLCEFAGLNIIQRERALLEELLGQPDDLRLGDILLAGKVHEQHQRGAAARTWKGGVFVGGDEAGSLDLAVYRPGPCE